MPKVTLLARLVDGLPLAASMADEKDAYAKEVRSSWFKRWQPPPSAPTLNSVCVSADSLYNQKMS